MPDQQPRNVLHYAERESVPRARSWNSVYIGVASLIAATTTSWMVAVATGRGQAFGLLSVIAGLITFCMCITGIGSAIRSFQEGRALHIAWIGLAMNVVPLIAYAILIASR